MAISDSLYDTANTRVFLVRPAMAGAAYKSAHHSATRDQKRIAVLAEEDAMGKGSIAAVTMPLLISGSRHCVIPGEQ